MWWEEKLLRNLFIKQSVWLFYLTKLLDIEAWSRAVLDDLKSHFNICSNSQASYDINA